MNFPSTHTDGANPASGAIVSNIESSHGVRLTGGSTGGIVESYGDDANISLTVRPKGTGLLSIGSTGGAAHLNSTTVRIGSASTTPIAAIQRFIVQFAPPEMAASIAQESTYTVTGLTTNAAIMALTPRLTFSTQYVVHSARCSTAAELTVVWMNKNASSIGTGESTNRWTLMAALF